MNEINRGIAILIVDDSRSMRRIVMRFLENNGFYNITEAPDGIEALEVVRTTAVDLIVSDLNMPRMDGLEFLKILKNDAKTRHIPFIMLTVEAIQKTMNKAVSLGVDSYIVKPVSEPVFIDEMIRVIRRSKG